MQPAISTVVKRVWHNHSQEEPDLLATEEPLEIRLRYHSTTGIQTKSISVTMRTPGHDAELALGFLYSEAIVASGNDITDISIASEENDNVLYVTLAPHIKPDLAKLERNFYTTSSCGVCGKASIEAVMDACPVLDTKDTLQISHNLIFALPEKLRQQQQLFEHTGGLHGVALFDLEGQILLLREDVGRHNAMDKLMGAAMNKGMLPLNSHILLLSGRASFELMQKAAMAGLKVVAAVGAPSSLAVKMAEEWGITLIGFLRDERYNIYTGAHRIVT